MHIPWDQVQCTLQAERVISSDSVRVFVQATLSLSGEGPARVRAMVTDALSAALDGKWRFSSIERKEDESGLERIVTVASVRVDEHATGGLVERLKKACRPGLRLELQKIATRPPKRDIDAARVQLRRELYQSASQEAVAINQSLPSDTQPWRVGSINISETLTSPGDSRKEKLARAGMSSLGYSAGFEEAEPTGVESATTLKLSAIVKIKRPSVPEPECGYFAARGG